MSKKADRYNKKENVDHAKKAYEREQKREERRIERKIKAKREQKSFWEWFCSLFSSGD